LQDIFKAGLFFVAKVFASDSKGDKRMNNLRQFCATAVLVFAMAFSAYAGNIECGGVVNPPPPPSPTATTTGEIECGGLQLAVSIITSVLSLS
jgi:hypothetical protein